MKHFLILLFAAACAGCLGSRELVPIQRYVLNPEIHVEKQPRLDISLGLRPLERAAPYSIAMLYRGEGFQLSARGLDEWAEQPSSMITRALIDALAATDRFEDVGDAALMSRPDYILTGELRKFYENRQRERHAAELELRLVLRASREQGAVWSELVQAHVFMDGASAEDFAAAMNQAVAEVAGKVAEKLAALPLPAEPTASRETPGFMDRFR